MNKLKTKELKKLPRRELDNISKYDSLLVINSKKKHESGFALMYIIGVINGEPKEIAACCDDIRWYVKPINIGIIPGLRTDMYHPSGIIHFWCPDSDFQVGYSLSSIDIEIIKKNKYEKKEN